VWKAAPVGFVGMWASIGVVAAVILVRLRDGDFGFRVGAGLFAIGGAAVILMCAQLRPSRPPDYKHVEAVYKDVGPVPDTLQPGAEILVNGTLAPDGWLEVVPAGIQVKRVRD